jgi:hypothetical protein
MPRLFLADTKKVEIWRGSPTSGSGSAIVSANSGYMEFHTLSTTDSAGAIFSLVALASNGGVKILKPGFVYVEANQDIISSGASGYLTFAVYNNGSTRALQLITHTNGQWDGIMVGTGFPVAANDTVQFYLANGDITSIDTGNSYGSWANYNIIWYGLAEE